MSLFHLLERIVTLSLQQERLGLSLKKISDQAGFTFSYNSDIIDGNKMITERFARKTVRQILR